MNCPYLASLEGDDYCLYLKGVVNCDGILIQGLVKAVSDVFFSLPSVSYCCPINGVVIGNRDELVFLKGLHQRLGLNCLEDELKGVDEKK